MNLTQNSIDQVRDASIVQVIGSFLKLKSKGSNHQGNCPFHNEKSPSFSVSETKGIYKCFGCGVSGDSIRFVMEHENLSFIDACKKIGDITGIDLEWEAPEDPEAYERKKTAIEQQEQALNIVVAHYKKKLFDLPEDHPVKVYLASRGITNDVMMEWHLGWAPENEWHTVAPMLINKNLYEAGSKLGIIRRAKVEEKNYDAYRSRIIIPITDRFGRFIGLAGRMLAIEERDKGKDIPKYINPSDCEIYNKSSVLFGLDRAAKNIKERRFVYLVEGYMDLISPFQAGIRNVVATCGTAFTSQQIATVKKFTNHIAVWRDNDTAGLQSFIKALDALLRDDFKVEKVEYEGSDPDAWALNQPPAKEGEPALDPKRIDAVIWRAQQLMEEAGDDPHNKARMKKAVLELVATIRNEIIRDYYADHLIKLFSWKADTKKQLAGLVEPDELEEVEKTGKFLPWMDAAEKERAMENGYIAVNRKVNGRPKVGYWGFGQQGMAEITNFLVTPLFRVEAGQESRYLSKIDNGFTSGVVDMPAKVIPSPEQFQGMCVAAAGAYFIYGSKIQWLRIATDLLHKYPVCMEVNELGWQRRGNFFAYVDKVYRADTGLLNLDEWGIVKFDDTNYLVPAGSEAYKKLQTFGKDPYENMRFLTHKVSPIDFSGWGRQMYRVYGQKGTVGIAYAILSIFRDLVFEVDNNCPHLYAFGEPSSGKSKWAESITAIFFYRRSAFNLNSGTDFAFFNFMSLFSNCPAHLNEFDIEVIKLEWFQAIKGAFDGEGRERGKLGAKNATEIQKITSTLILTGQKLVTVDDNSVVTRSIIEPFSTNNERTEQDKKEYDKLKDWEREGMNSILTEVLAHRKMFEANYKEEFNGQLSAWRKHNPMARDVNQRILQNFGHLATCYRLIAGLIKMPQTVEEFTAYCFDRAIHWSKFIRSSDTLSEFWNTMAFLADQGSIIDGWDYAIEIVNHVNIRRNGDDTYQHNFNEPTKVIFIRLQGVHKQFQVAFRTRTGKEAMTYENLVHYFSSRKYFIGAVKKKRFKRFAYQNEEKVMQGLNVSTVAVETFKRAQEAQTSCHVFLYDMLDLEIERNVPPGLEGEENPPGAGVENSNSELKDQELPF